MRSREKLDVLIKQVNADPLRNFSQLPEDTVQVIVGALMKYVVKPNLEDHECTLPYIVSLTEAIKKRLRQSNEIAGHVCYFRTSMKDGVLEVSSKVVRSKLSAWLAKYFPDIPAHVVGEISNTHTTSIIVDEVLFARTREEIKYVYENGPYSCMGKSASNFSTGGIHPAEVYASGECAVAYIKDGDRIISRAVTNEKDKQYSRIYGNEIRLRNALYALGYSEGGIAGCKLLRLETDRGFVVAPYIDYTPEVYVYDDCLYVEEPPDAEYIDNQIAEFTNGLLNGEMESCESCGECMHEHEATYVEGCGLICECCRDEHFVYAHISRGHSDWIRYEDAVEYDGEWYYYYNLDEFDLVVIEGEVYSMEDVVYSEFHCEYIVRDDAVEVVMESDGTTDYLWEDDTHLYEEDPITGTRVFKNSATKFVLACGEFAYTFETDELVEDGLSAGTLVWKDDATEYTDLLDCLRYTIMGAPDEVAQETNAASAA